MSAVRLVFGLGATKAGSSWFYRYLRAHPECHVRSLKELHFFDTLDFGLTKARLAKLQRLAEIYAQMQRDGTSVRRKVRDLNDWLPVVESEDPAAYLRYLERGVRARSVVADVTPAYSLVSRDQLRRMAGLVPDTRFVFLLRDPVARLWSHICMVASKRATTEAAAAELRAELVERTLGGREKSITRRGDYDEILPRLRSAIPADRLFVDYFEDIVPKGAIDRLCAFLGIAPQPVVIDRPHVAKSASLAPDERARIGAFLAPQYDFIRAEMGRLPPAWDYGMARG